MFNVDSTSNIVQMSYKCFVFAGGGGVTVWLIYDCTVTVHRTHHIVFILPSFVLLGGQSKRRDFEWPKPVVAF